MPRQSNSPDGLSQRARKALGDVSQQELADSYDVVQTTISRIVLREVGRHVP